MKALLAQILLIGIVSASWWEILGLGHLEHRDFFMKRALSQNYTCRLNYTTNLWSSCAQVLQDFNLTITEFQAVNPSIGINCTNFIPGKEYCVMPNLNIPPPIPISPNGLCGVQQNWTNTCLGSQWGNCCGVNGHCGKSEEYCGLGNCQEGNCTGAPIPYSTNGLCGSQNDYLECPPKFGLCCSNSGRCGNGTEYCGAGCQSGPCGTSSSTTSTKPTPTQKPGSTSEDGTCGYLGGLTCNGSTFGDCCSAAGYCGSNKYYCLDILGCQPKFGACNITGHLAIVRI